MAFDRPTLTELAARSEADVRGRLGLGPLLRRSTLAILSRVFAGLTHGLHGHLDYVSDQIIPDTAEAEFLERWADLYGLQRKAAAFATGTVTFTGTDGATIPAGTLVQRTDATRYATDADATIASGSATATVTASESGKGGNADAATVVNLITPIAGVTTEATATSAGFTGGLDAETDAELRARLRELLQSPPQGGSVADYEAWALQVEGVTRAFAIPSHFGEGTVGVTFVTDGETSPIPTSTKVDEVQARLTDTTRRDSAPVTAAVTAFAPTAVTVDFTIAVLPNTSAVQAAVTSAITDLFLREARPGGTIPLTKVTEAIATAPGEDSHTLTAPAADIVAAAGELAILGTITYA